MGHCHRASLAALCCLVLSAAVANATIIVYTNEASFLAAQAIASTETFDSYPQNTVLGTGTAIVDQVHYVAQAADTDWQVIAIFVHPSPPNGFRSATPLLDGKMETLSFGPGLTSDCLGFYFCKGQMTPAHPQYEVTATTYGGEVWEGIVMSDAPFNTYFGFASPQGIRSVSVQDIPGDGRGMNWEFDNVSRGLVFAIPEPATLSLLGLGGLGLLLRRRKP